MTYKALLISALFLCIGLMHPLNANPIAKISINIAMPNKPATGDIIIELLEKEAPKTIRNFVQYIRDDFYSGTIFHRVIDGFMIQGGGLTEKQNRKPTRRPIINEAHNKIPHYRGSIAMARTSDTHSATAQFFINTSDNPELNHKNTTRSGYGYTVFGNVIKGMHLVDRISAIPIYAEGYHRNLPIYPVTITSITLIKESEETKAIKATTH